MNGTIREDGLLEIPTGVALEYKLTAPPTRTATATGSRKLAVCLHPWSWLGGRMSDPVLGSLKDVLFEQGYHILRYNSRGVGKSTGRSTFSGVDEGKDLEAVVKWGVAEVGQVATVVIIGYSHGSLITTLHPSLEGELSNVKLAYVLLSYPLGPRSFLTLFKGSYYDQKLDELVTSGKSKILIAFGGQDEFTSYERYSTWASGLEKKATSAETPGEPKLRILGVPGASHFWLNETNDILCTELSRWLAEL